MKQASGISIVVTTWNKRELAEKCISHLCERFAGHNGPWEIVMVDNGSTDGTAGLIAKKHTTVRIIALPGNIGFGPAANLGIQGSKYSLVLLMNDDMELAPGFIGPMARHFSDPAVFAVAPKMIFDDGKEYGRTVASMQWGHIMLTWVADAGPTNFLVGGAGFFRRKHLLALGGFDSMYAPFYWEDADLCFRAWRRGWRLLYEPDSIVYHHQGATIKGKYHQRFINDIANRNRLLFHWKNITDPVLLWQHFIFLLLRCVRRAVIFDFSESRALILALSKLKRIPFRRRQEKTEICRTERQVFETINRCTEKRP